MPRTTVVESPGCPPLRALTTDIIGLVKGIPSHPTPTPPAPRPLFALLRSTDSTRFPRRLQSSRPTRSRRAPPRSSRRGAILTPPAPSSLPPLPIVPPTP